MAYLATGKATIDGISGTWPVALAGNYAKTMKLTVNGKERIETDNFDNDVAWRVQNLNYTVDIMFLLSGASVGAIAAAGGLVIAPLTTITLADFKLTQFNGVYQVLLNQDFDLAADKSAGMSLKLRKYSDPTQNTLAVTAVTSP